MGSSGGVETKQKQNGKTSQFSTSAMSLPPDIVGSVAGASPSHPTEANRGTLRLGTRSRNPSWQ